MSDDDSVDVRPIEPGDADPVRDIYAPFVRETPVTFSTEVPSAEKMREKVRRKLASDRYPWYVAESEGRVVGYAYAGTLRERDAYQWAVEVSVYVDPSAQRGGIGGTLYDRLFDTLREQGYVAAYAALAMPNPDSATFHEAMGFEHVGTFPDAGFKLGAWHDIEWYRKRLRDPPNAPESPRPVSAADAAFASASARE
ncbi:GNAT family N-acetyltransferase [Halogeometricum limi]|uniref:Phosphinothricin acetyltransferase n=1 Tax=Halogeometricum limi TaxID=555875 RepID=A0A1I6G6R0_9EURY|nr:GNAT family N-acetyltransferase [Halogeometricum limi]SFR37884.1 phosphinothricin acetyltransferase [Halogeometricum limi]